jgi:hypothetical protein
MIASVSGSGRVLSGVAGAPGRQAADTLRPRHDRMESRHESLDLAVVEYRAVAEVTGEQRRPNPF